MTLDDAIQHAETIGHGTPQTACMRDHAQLSAWLRELRTARIALASIEAGNLDGETFEMFHDRARQEARAALGR